MTVFWTKLAHEDLAGIRAYVARDSSYYAARLARRIVDAVDRLRRFPEIGQIVPKFDRYVVRDCIVQNYRILYTVEKGRVVILAVVHAARDLDSITLPERT